MRPYDGTTRRYRHSDAVPQEGLALVRRLLRAGDDERLDELAYECALFSGGIGILDELAVSVKLSRAEVDRIVARLGALPIGSDGAPERNLLDDDDDDPTPLAEAAVAFINRRRRPFQAECSTTHAIWFEPGSDVNSWTALWYDGTHFGYLGFAQG